MLATESTESVKSFLERYQAFLSSKVQIVSGNGFIPVSEPHPSLKPHQRVAVNWAIQKGQAALFASFGTGKTRSQLQLMRWVHEHTGKKTLIVAPLGVRQEFTRNDGPAMGMDVVYCRTDAEVAACNSPYVITNYERVRDGCITVSQFGGASLDEASCLRSLGSLTTQTFIDIFQSVPYRFVATATPSPNSYKELAHYAYFLGVMDLGQILTRFFQRDSKQAGNLTLYPHMEEQFWLWVASWALFISKPSDVTGNSEDDRGYDLPPLNVHWHSVPVDYAKTIEFDGKGQGNFVPDHSSGLKAASKGRRDTLPARIEKAIDIIQAEPEKHWLLWHDLEPERQLIEKLLPEARTVYGSQELEEREDLIMEFSAGKYRVLATKPTIAGSGCNFQRYCADAVFVNPSRDDKFNDFIQAIHRIYRFLQTKKVNIHIVYAETQQKSVENLKRKWKQHEKLVAKMQSIVKKYGLSSEALQMKLARTIGCDRVEVKGENFTLVNNDCVVETALMADDSVDEIITSEPFSDQYEYSPSYNDFGHNDGGKGFFAQMDFLIPQLYRVLKPGRMACVHTKDRIRYGSVTGHGMYTVDPFSDDTVTAFRKHGFLFCGRICIDTDVVRENAQTYRLGWTENAKDSTKMGCGSLEYVLLFRKWHPSMSPDDTANGPKPVTKDNEQYTRSRWQIEASGIWRSSGDRLVDPHFIQGLPLGQIKAWWERYTKSKVYDYHEHVKFCEAIESVGALPAAWMLFAPHSNNPDVWTDILRINTLNTEQSRKVQESHVCPLQIDVIERLINRFSNPGDLIFDPFMGIGSVGYQALKMGRRAYGAELNRAYWSYSVGYCEQVEAVNSAPTLFDLNEFLNQSAGISA
jgi:DNA modification methylase